MKRVIFKNSKGELKFCVGTEYNLSSIDADEIKLSTQTENYIGTDGDADIEILYDARVVTLKGYIKAQNKSHLRLLRQKLLRVLNGKDSGELTVNAFGKEYFAVARAESIPTFGESIQNMQTFVCYFKIPTFYWKEKLRCGNSKKIYERVALVTSETSIINGAILTKRTSQGEVFNNGDVAGDMKITLKCISNPGLATKGIVISNLTTGENMAIKHTMKNGEKIVVNTEIPSIRSYFEGVETNILHELEGDFIKLPLGANVIKVTNNDIETGLEVSLEYFDKFAGVGICS